MSRIDIVDLIVKYTYGATAIDRLNLSAVSGEIFTVLGGSESGKTSLLKCIAGLIEPVSGEINFNGIDIAKKPVKDRNVCLFYESDGFFINRTVKFNLEFPLKIRKIEDRKRVIADAMNVTGLNESVLSKRIKKISAEEKFLVGLTRLAMRDAEIFLIDNPLKEISSDRNKYFDLLLGVLRTKKDSVIIYATSEGEDALRLRGECILLNYGITLQRGKVEDMVSAPSTVGAIKAFHCEESMEKGLLGKGFLTLSDGEKIFIDDKKLLSDIFIGTECLVYRKNGLRLYDIRSERLIYFD